MKVVKPCVMTYRNGKRQTQVLELSVLLTRLTGAGASCTCAHQIKDQLKTGTPAAKGRRSRTEPNSRVTGTHPGDTVWQEIRVSSCKAA
jgi:hypothetical protein